MPNFLLLAEFSYFWQNSIAIPAICFCIRTFSKSFACSCASSIDYILELNKCIINVTWVGIIL